jgi:hypothetical protein
LDIARNPEVQKGRRGSYVGRFEGASLVEDEMRGRLGAVTPALGTWKRVASSSPLMVNGGVL